MKIILFGATGMIGQGVLRECLADPVVELVLAAGRSPLAQDHAKLQKLIVSDLYNVASYENQMAGYDLCFFSLGASAAGLRESAYRHINFDLPVAVANALARINPQMTFLYISGAGTDSTEKGRSMWARVKGQTENAILRLPFKAAYMFRIGAVPPMHGIKSKTSWYNTFYTVGAPLFFLLHILFPQHILTTEQLGRAVLAAARRGAPKPILESADIFRLLDV
jgi:hypothetical protein